MITVTTVAQHAVRILSYADNAMSLKGDTRQDDILMALYNIHKLSPAYVVVTCPAQHGNFFYISENCDSVFGYSAEYMATNFRALPAYFSQLHEADLPDFQNCLSALESYIQDGDITDYPKIRIVLHYRFLGPDGQYVYLQDEKASLITTQGDIVHYSLIRSMPAETVFAGVKMEIFKQEKTLQKVMEHRPSAATKKLSNRENDLVHLIKKGLTTKEIAWRLSISHNTVRNIKSKLFEKYSVNNTIELLNMTG